MKTTKKGGGVFTVQLGPGGVKMLDELGAERMKSPDVALKEFALAEMQRLGGRRLSERRKAKQKGAPTGGRQMVVQLGPESWEMLMRLAEAQGKTPEAVLQHCTLAGLDRLASRTERMRGRKRK